VCLYRQLSVASIVLKKRWPLARASLSLDCEEEVLCFTFTMTAHELIKKEQARGVYSTDAPTLDLRLLVEHELSSVGSLMVAMYVPTSTSDSSWLVFTRGKACYNPVYHR
jgi:hypothetical protein